MFQASNISGGVILPPDRSAQRAEKTRFGCRLEGVMIAQNTPYRDTFVKEAAAALPQMAQAEQRLTQSVNPSASLLQKEQSHGWGFAFFTAHADSPVHVTRPRNVLGDSDYRKATQTLAGQTVTSGLTHVRVATDGAGPKAENTHPFRLDMDGAHWTFVHNGRWNQSLTDTVKRQLVSDPAFTPKGATDSEHAFLYLMRSVRQQLGTLNTGVAGQEATKRAFAQAIRQITQTSESPFYAAIPASSLNISGKLKMGPSHNFIANDGKMMLAYKHGQSLYLGVQLGPDGKPFAHTVATVPRNAPNLRWFDLQDDTLVVITRNPKDGTSQAELTPLELVPELEPSSKLRNSGRQRPMSLSKL